MIREAPRRLLFFALTALFCGTAPCFAATRPNIILIVADDVGYGDFGCYGQKLIRTPNIDRLAGEGIRFTQAYAGGPVCTPSRCVLMTGLHNGHTAARDNVPHYRSYLEDRDVTVAEVLQSAGYRCFGVGKWSLGDAGTVGRATNQGFDHWFGYLNQDHAHYYYPEYLDNDEGRHELRGNTQSQAHYSHDLLTDRALRFIRESTDDPFFLYVAYTIPHFSSKEEDRDGLTVPSTEPYADRDWPEKSKKYASMIHMLDRDVGRLFNLVDEKGIAEQTIVLLTSDNGGHRTLPEPIETSGQLRGFKRDLTEGGIRVPFIARWKGVIPQDVVSNQIIAFQDILPTFAQLAGARSPQQIDGISIVDALYGRKLTQSRDFLYWDYGHCRNRYHQAVRWSDWKGIRSKGHSEEPGMIELYDLANDPTESNDIARRHPAVVRRIRHIMETAPIPSEKYTIGKIYKGRPIWTKSD